MIALILQVLLLIGWYTVPLMMTLPAWIIFLPALIVVGAWAVLGTFAGAMLVLAAWASR